FSNIYFNMIEGHGGMIHGKTAPLLISFSDLDCFYFKYPRTNEVNSTLFYVTSVIFLDLFHHIFVHPTASLSRYAVVPVRNRYIQLFCKKTPCIVKTFFCWLFCIWQVGRFDNV